MVHCGPHEGRHTVTLVAEGIDAVIESLEIPGLLEAVTAMTTENAANMLAACKEAKHVHYPCNFCARALGILTYQNTLKSMQLRQGIHVFIFLSVFNSFPP